jgi:hypothetical protein
MRSTAEIEFQIRFASLRGAEKLTTSLRPDNWEGLCQETVFSDISRSNDLFPSSRPARIWGFTKWTLLSHASEGEGRLLRNGGGMS